ncbi:amidohydrolase family protein [Ferrimicrobium sp.]|uniref:metal-dependent hydrolase family protein n=1 Tax=Ferrimicrobium sp. TaxID=2926050 RepID=UPI002618C13F|nr:amidohydrolase family protein [Ferrimicrobium sp.]
MVRTLFQGGQLFDGTGSGMAPADVVVEDGKIIEVGNGLDGDQVVDCTGKALLPGLFDCHVHVTSSGVDTMRRLTRPFSYQFYEAEANLKATLDLGITTIRDASGADLGVQQAVEDGLIAGPRMQISVTAISQTGGHGDGWLPSGINLDGKVSYPGRPSGIVDGPEEMRKKVREIIRSGGNVIKVFTSGGVLSPRDNPRHGHFRDDELQVLVAEANAAGIFVMAHAQASDGIKAAIRAGIRSIEHGVYLDDEAIEMMLAKGTWLVPTLIAPISVVESFDQGASLQPAVIAKARELLLVHQDSFARAVKAGVKIAMGTDSGVGAHGTNLRELALMEAGGMDPGSVLVATTHSAAQLMGLEGELGTVEPGKRADLVVVDGDPFDFSRLKENVSAVYKDGVLVSVGQQRMVKDA